MKILIYSDVHWSTYSSIIRKRGEKYSQRLEYLIAGMNWLNKLASEQECSAMICAGDFFDRSQISDEELTALRDINWNNLPCYFLCGNHESSVADLHFNALKALETENHFIITAPQIITLDKIDFYFLPYIIEDDKKPILEYFPNANGKQVLISHNDLLGVNYGSFECKLGFPLNELSKCFKLVLNGHIHNSEWVDKNVLNLGSFSAHNFTNDALKYQYGVWILDTDTLAINFFENPYSLNFYKFDFNTRSSIKRLENIKTNSVLSIKCSTELAPEIKAKLESMSTQPVEQKLIITAPVSEVTEEASLGLISEDHIQKLITFCYEKLANTEVLTTELSEICK